MSRYLPPPLPPPGPMPGPRGGDNVWIRHPELVAFEQRILTLADALVSWMREQPYTPADEQRWMEYMRLPGELPGKNPGGLPLEPGTIGPGRHLVLEKFDEDANRLFAELLRAAWQRRAWQVYYGERKTVENSDE